MKNNILVHDFTEIVVHALAASCRHPVRLEGDAVRVAGSAVVLVQI